MVSSVEDDFGEVYIKIVADLSTSRTGFVSRINLICPESVPVSLRISEMQHFLSLCALFDPQFNNHKDGLPEIVSQTPPWTQDS